MSWEELDRELRRHDNWSGTYPCKLRIRLAASDIQLEEVQAEMLEYMLQHEIRLFSHAYDNDGRELLYEDNKEWMQILHGPDIKTLHCRPLPDLLRIYGKKLLKQGTK